MAHPETKTVTIALGQMRVIGGDPETNLQRALSFISEAAPRASLIVLPEVLDCGWCDQSAHEHAQALAPGSPAFDTLSQAAAKHDILVCAGLTERSGDDLYNAAVLFERNGTCLLTHRKVNELELAHELYRSGKGAEGVANTSLGSIGLMICADGFAPEEALTNELIARGARLIVSPCAWAVPPDHDQERDPYGALWRDVYGRPAAKHRITIAAASNVGAIRHGLWSGHPCIGCSLIVGPDGQVVASGGYGTEEIVYAEITL